MVIYKSGVKGVSKEKVRVSCFRRKMKMISFFVFLVSSLVFSCNLVRAIDEESTLVLNVQSSSLGIRLLPSIGGSFGESSNATISIGTDNSNGYSLSINTVGGTSLVNQNDDEIESISSAISAETFSSDSTYNNKWGFKPSQYISTVNNIDTVINNSNFLPAPSEQGLLIARSASANDVVNDQITTDAYTFSFGARIDNTLPADTYTATYVVTAVANLVVDPFPVVWSQMGACEFHGKTNGNITGSECTKYQNEQFIDTGVSLYSDANFDKDYQVHFKIDTYNPSNQSSDKQQTFFNDKLSSSAGSGKAPGIIVRRDNSTNKIEINSRVNDSASAFSAVSTEFSTVDIYRIDSIIYYSLNGGPLVQLQSLANTSETFGLSAWFGGYPNNVDCTEGCTQAKRFIEATMSEMYIRLGEYDTSNLHTITFNSNGGSPSTLRYLIADGNALGVLPTVTKSNWVINGWFTDQSGDTEVTAETIPSGDTTYLALWLKSIAQAVISNTDLELSINNSETISITNPADFEPYTFSSSDSTIATVDASTGEVTGISSGSTTIIMTGTKSGATRTINVTVAGNDYTVSFDADGGTTPEDIEVANGGKITNIPKSTKAGYKLYGWYTGANGTGTRLESTTAIHDNLTYHAYWREGDYVCKIAPAETLHTETCNRSDGNGCNGAGYARNEVITYGNVVSSTTMVLGDAYNCNINNDSTYDSATERFYFAGMNGDKAIFNHYTNIANADSNFNPSLELLYDNSVWTNPYLIDFGDGKVTRMLTVDEAISNCGDTSNLFVDDTCIYLVEQSNFANTDKRDGIWLQKYNGTVSRIQSKMRQIDVGGTTANAVRPAIEVPIAYVEPYDDTPPASTYEITFDPHNETSSWTETIDEGDTLAEVYPATDPVYADRIFQGWYTAAFGGTLVTSSIQPSGDATYHGQWKGTVALANINSTSKTIVEGNTFTIEVSNASNIEAYTLTSNDTSVATVDSSTGVVTGVAEGSTTITLEGAESHATRTINITVTEASTAIAVCKLAVDGSLHTATVGNNTVTYGQIAASTTPTAGDAYDCDVDLDDNYNATNERFYYIGQNGDNAVLVAYSGFDGLTDGDALGWHIPSNTKTGAYAYGTAATKLPDTTFWDNPDLATQTVDGNTYAARFLTKAEVEGACGSGAMNTNCNYLLENSKYDSLGRTGIWLMYDGSTYWRLHTGNKAVVSVANTSENMARPVIEIPFDLLEKYQAPPAQNYTVTFNSAGGSSVEPVDILGGSALGSDYPADPTKINNKFFGWYTDSSYNTEVTPETIINGDVTYYARWIGNTTGFPIVFSETNECEFTGSAVVGTYCTHTSNNQYYIDSDIKLFTETDDMYQKDFEIGLTLTDYSSSTSGQDSQATLVNSKQEVTGYPGFVLRRTNADFQLTAKFGNSGNPTDATISSSTLKHVRIVRSDGKMYYAWNGDKLTEWHDISNFSTRFDTEVWFGGATASNGTSAMRPLRGKMTDMYIRLGTYEDGSDYKIQFDARGGTASETIRYVERGQQLGALPTVTRAGNYTFNGWYDEDDVQVTATTIPTKSQTYHADWTYASSLTPVAFDTSNDAMKGYYNIVDGWLNDGSNITQFNKDATTINNSTWGDTTVLSESDYWDALQDNFESNGCDMRASVYGSTETALRWASGPNDCSKPKVYDTGIGEGLNVYLYDTTNSTKGAQVYYTKSDAGLIANMVPGQTYYWEKSDDTDVYGVVSASADRGTRMIEAGNVHNVRDLGGLPATYTDSNNQTVTGTVKYERLFRGERLWNDSANATGISNLGLTSDGQAPFVQYDVANAGELGDTAKLATYVSSPVIHYEFAYGYGDGTNYTKARNAVTGIMTDIVAHNNVYFHCRVGADRTGTTAYLLEGLLGVPDESRYEEYSLSHLSGLTDRTRYYKQKASNNAKKFVFMMDYVLTNQDIYDWYMQGSTNVSADEALIQAFRAEMIE